MWLDISFAGKIEYYQSLNKAKFEKTENLFKGNWQLRSG